MNAPLCPYIRRAYYSTLRPNHYIRERVLFDYELLYIKDGNVNITIEDTPYSGKAGDLFIIRPGMRHSIRVNAATPLVQPHLHFDLLYRENREQIPVSFKNAEELTEEEKTFFPPEILDLFYSPFPIYLRPHMPRLIELMLFDVIHASENSDHNPSQEIRVASLFYRLWDQVLNEISYNFEPNSDQLENQTKKIKLYIENNLSRPMNMQELADLTHFSKNYIYTIYQQEYHISPLKYHTLLRVEKAKSLLKNTSMSVSETAEFLGFSSVQTFCRTFKNVDGFSPSHYKHIELSSILP